MLFLVFFIGSWSVLYSTELTLYYVSNNLGEIEPCGCVKNQLGGLDRRATVLKQIDFAKQPNFLFDTGDLFFKAKRLEGFIRDQLLLKADLITKFYNRFRPDGMIFGEIDLAQGVAFLKEKGRAELPYLALNLYDEKTDMPLFRTHAVIERGGVKIAVIGVLSKSLFESVAGGVPGVLWKDSKTLLPALIKTLKSKTDLIVVLSHEQAAEEDDLFSSLSEFVVVLSGHDGEALAEPRRLKNNVLIFEADARGQYVGKVKIVVANSAKPFVNMGEISKIEADLSFLAEERKELVARVAKGDPMVANLDRKAQGLRDQLKQFPQARENRFWSELVPLDTVIMPDVEVRQMLEAHKRDIGILEKKN